MISILLDKNVVKVLAFFLISPGSRHLRKEIKEKTLMNNSPLDTALKKLLKTQIIKEEKSLLFLNPEETEETKSIKMIITKEHKILLSSIPLKVFDILLDAAEKLSQFKEIKEAYLFGSYSKLIYSIDSDIDIAVILINKIKNPSVELKIEKQIKRIEKKAKKLIELHFFQGKDMKANDALIKEILRNGRKMM